MLFQTVQKHVFSNTWMAANRNSACFWNMARASGRCLGPLEDVHGFWKMSRAS